MRLEADRDRLRHMLRAGRQALEYAESTTQEQMLVNPPLQHLFIRNLEIMGEAAARLSNELRDAHPEVPWNKMIGIRNRLIHAYFDTDMDIVWNTVTQSLPEVLPKLEAIIVKADLA
jgi:uncharacterized protein with HEPN domain